MLASIAIALIASNFIFGGSADENINIKTNTASDYIQSKSSLSVSLNSLADKEESKQNADTDKKNDSQKLMVKHFSSILQSINSFSSATGQPPADANGIEDYFIENTKELPTEEYISFLNYLSTSLLSLEKEKAKIALLKNDDKDYIDWQNFIKWNTELYLISYNNELERIQDEALDIKSDKTEGINLALVSLALFALFVLSTLILVLLQIESNTRKE